MHLDCTKYPKGHTFAEAAGEALGLYVKVADFAQHKGRRIFRMIIDPELDKNQLFDLISSTVKDQQATYEFSYMEIIQGPIVDQVPGRATTTSYIRVTFM